MNALSTTPAPSNDSFRTSNEAPPPPPPPRWSSDSFDKTRESSSPSHKNETRASLTFSPSSEEGELRLSMLRSHSEGGTSGDESPVTFEGHSITQVSSFSNEVKHTIGDDLASGQLLSKDHSSSDASFSFGLEDLQEIVNESTEKLAATQKKALRECQYLVNLYTNFTDVDDRNCEELEAAIAKLEEANSELSHVSNQHDPVIQEANKLIAHAKNIVHELRIEEIHNEEDYRDEVASWESAQQIKALFSPSEKALHEIKQQVTLDFQRQDKVNKKTFSLPKEMLRRQECFCQTPTQESTLRAIRLAQLATAHLTPEVLQPTTNDAPNLAKYAREHARLAKEQCKEAQRQQEKGDFQEATRYAQSAMENALNVVMDHEVARYGNSSKLLLTLKKEQ
ncbi:MAG: hypothetical protein K2W99_04215 [Chthoniobacterales bacterium]|nr:hypothetical protein [Chthoniobacterales bacterium]